MKEYKQALQESYVLKDMNNFQDAVQMLHSPQMFNDVPNVICDFGRKFFTIDDKPMKKSRTLLSKSIKKHSSYWKLLKLAFKGGKSL